MDNYRRPTPLFIACLVLLIPLISGTPSLSGVSPAYIGKGGQVTVTIFGSGLNGSPSGMGTPVEAVKDVTFVKTDGLISVKADVIAGFNDGTSIIVHSRLMEYGTYTVVVEIDGVTATGKTVYVRVRDHLTPTIEQVLINGNAAPEGAHFLTEITVIGDIMSSFANNTDLARNSSNGVTAKHDKAYELFYVCDRLDPNGNAYAILLDNIESRHGKFWMKCSCPKVGMTNVSYVLEQPFGRSVPELNTIYSNCAGQKGMYDLYPEILTQSENAGSDGGGTSVILTGYFGTPSSDVQVYVSGTLVTDVVSRTRDPTTGVTTMEIRTPIKPATSPTYFKGGRGCVIELWHEASDPLNTSHALTSVISARAADATTLRDISRAEYTGASPYVVGRMKCYYTPCSSGKHEFFLSQSTGASADFHLSTTDMDQLTVTASTTALFSGPKTFLIGSVNPAAMQTLSASEAYYMEVIFQGPNGTEVEVSVFSSVSPFNTGEVRQVYNHKDDIVFNSPTTSIFSQKLDFTSWPATSQTKASDVWEVEIHQPTNSAAKFRLGIGGAYTRLIASDSSSINTELQGDLGTLPSLGAVDTVSVALKPGSTTIYTITIDSANGPIPSLVAVDENFQAATSIANVARTTIGAGDADNYVFTWDGHRSPAVPKGATDAEVRTALKSMLSVRCPTGLFPPVSGSTLHHFDYESTGSDAVEAFQGEKSLQTRSSWLDLFYSTNPTIPIHTTGFIGFCYKFNGCPPKNYIYYYVNVLRANGIKHSGWRNFAFEFVKDKPASRGGWRCAVINLKEKVEAAFNIMPASTWDGYISRVRLHRSDYCQDERAYMYFDDFFTAQAVLSSYNQLTLTDEIINDLPARCISPPFRVTDLTVNKTSDEYQIDIDRIYDCKQPGDVEVEGDASWWGKTSISQAHPPITGTFTVTRDGKSHTITLPVTAADLKAELEGNLDIGEVDVERIDTPDICYDGKFRITYLTKPGAQPALTVSSSLTPATSTVAIVNNQNGGQYHQPITGSFLRTPHTSSNPQLTMTVDSQPARCKDDHLGTCKFAYSSGLTPVVNSPISPTSGTEGDVLTIGGSAFDDTTIANNVVKVGSAPCVVSAATATQITCTLGCGVAGSGKEVNVYVKSKGAPTGTPPTFIYNTKIDTISPNTGSLAGCTIITITGCGYDQTTTVTVDGNTCTIADPTKDVTTTKILCEVPAKGSTGAVDVAVTTIGQTVTSTGGFTYTAAPATITSVSATTASAVGGEVILITGSGFLPSALDWVDEVLVGGVKAKVTFPHTDTEINITLPHLPDGTHGLKVVTTRTAGCAAKSNALPTITVDFKLASMCTHTCSAYGGCTITFTGSGFPTDAHNNLAVTVGDTACEIPATGTATSTQFTCELGGAEKVTKVIYKSDGNKKHEWLPRVAAIEAGDCVEWTWEVADGTTYEIQVEQVDSGFSQTRVSNGFQSATKAGKGIFKHCFATTGTFYYWSTNIVSTSVAGLDIFFHGTVTVSQKTSRTVAATVTTKGPGGVQPNYPTTNPCPAVASLSCNTVNVPVTGTTCATIGTVTTGIPLLLDPCLSPKISTMSTTVTASQTTLSFTGTDFGTSCVTVLVGGHACTVSAVTTTTIACTLDHAATQIAAFTTHDVKVLFGDKGKPSAVPRMQIEQAASVVSATPTSGSLGGCTEVTINGFGFSTSASDMAVTIGGITNCAVQSSTYTEIVCKTDAGSGSAAAIEVKLRGKTVACDGGTCPTFTFDTAKTPAAATATPSSVTAAGIVTITGTNFGATTSTENVTVTLGNTYTCTPQSVTDTQITCSIASLPVVPQTLHLNIANLGCDPGSSLRVSGTPAVSGVTPPSGSTAGCTKITIDGQGFDPTAGATTVTLNGQACRDVTVNSPAQLTCVTPVNAAGSYDIAISASGTAFPQTHQFTYSTSDTPTVTAISTSSGAQGDSLVIDGTGFSTTLAENEVTIAGAACVVTAATSTEITCTVGPGSPGAHDVNVRIDNKGCATGAFKFTHNLAISSVNPISGSMAGGHTITVLGNGIFTTSVSITVCGDPCTDLASTGGGVTCRTPDHAAGACDVVATATSGGATVTKPGAYTYLASKTPDVSDVTPRRGGTAGGTSVTLTGTKFGSPCDQNTLSVTIDDVACAVSSCNDTHIICKTAAVPKSVNWQTRCTDTMTATNNVKVHRPDCGDATFSMNLNGKRTFHYVDLWSSKYTWNGTHPPLHGEVVQIPTGQAVLLDISTARLRLLVIQGCLIFEDKGANTDIIELIAEYILITDGGLLQVGTEQDPYMGEARITLTGTIRSVELPVYGSKVLAIRNGTLDLYGRPTPVTWTLLESTAEANDTTITLQTPVNWRVGDEIVIATTGGHQSQHETEVRKITAISTNMRTLTLDKALTYKHMGVTETFNTDDCSSDVQTFEVRAEVGLLTHNVKVRGEINDTNFDPGCDRESVGAPFPQQMCYGNDQFGGGVMVSGAESADASKNETQAAVGRLFYVELTHMGQAFRLGRYPVHFHKLGDASNSRVEGCSIYHTFNRAVNIHATNNVTVHNNVVYDVMGGALFLEDGVERWNVISQNYFALIVATAANLVDDLTPACIWITNPQNKVRDNHAVGSYGFGIWYRMHRSGDGSSQTIPACPDKEPLWEFENNTVHSHGRYGLWVFEFYMPRESCSSTKDVTAVFRTLTAWNNLRGAEWGEVGCLQFDGFKVANNFFAGIEMLMINKLGTNCPLYNSTSGPAIKNSVIIAYLPSLNPRPPATLRGLVLPFDSGLITDKVYFINFNGATHKGTTAQAIGTVKIVCTCQQLCAGYEYWFKLVKRCSTSNNVLFEWEHQAEILDVDGSMTGTAGQRVVAKSDMLPPSCNINAAPFSTGQYPAQICPPSVDLCKINFNNPEPSSNLFKEVVAENGYGSSILKWRFLSNENSKGWFMTVPCDKCSSGLNPDHAVRFWWKDNEHISNFSYAFGMFGIEENCLQIEHNLTQSDPYDQVEALPGAGNEVFSALTASNDNGDWRFDNTSKVLSYLIKDTSGEHVDVKGQLKALDCFFAGCVVPSDAASLQIPVVGARPANAVRWHDLSTWTTGRTSMLSGSAQSGIPQSGSDVTINDDVYIVIDEATNLDLKSLSIIKGTVEFNQTLTATMSFYHLYIGREGKLVAGYPNDRYTGSLTLLFKGDHSTPDWPRTDGPNIGSKVIAVFGGMDLHGADSGLPWSRLSATANAGDRTVSLVDSVSGKWNVDDEIIFAPTGYGSSQTEVRRISAISGSTVTLNASLTHTHLVYSDSACSSHPAGSCSMATEVGHLTRTVRLVGHNTNGLMYSESFGCRVLIGTQTDFTQSLPVAARGWARIDNVEFQRCGQLGYTENYDPRAAVAWVTTGETSPAKPSYLRGCAFHQGLGVGAVAYGAKNITFSKNVIAQTIGQGIKTDATWVTLDGNLVVYCNWPGSYNGRRESDNKFMEGCIEVHEAQNVTLKNNAVAGSERVGYRVDGEYCDRDGPGEEPWSDNTAHSGIIGIAIFPNTPGETQLEPDGVPGERCSRVRGFRVWRQWGYGFYAQISNQSTVIEKCMFCECRVATYTMVVGPDIKKQEKAPNVIHIKNSAFIGRTDAFDCANDKPDTTTEAAEKYAFQYASVMIPISLTQSNRFTAIAGMCSSAGNLFPFKPLHLGKLQPAAWCNTEVADTCFAHYKNKCPSQGQDVITSQNKLNKDIEPKVSFVRSTKEDIGSSSWGYTNRPDAGSAKPEKCGSMPCSGPSRFLVEDVDGSLFGAGSKAFLASDSVYEYNGNPAYGLGDNRLPPAMHRDTYGNLVPIANIYEERGIYGVTANNWDSDMQLHKIAASGGLELEFLHFQSMDSDYIDRIIAPVAIRTRDSNGKRVVNIVNEPSDAGICGGYPCMERPTYFWIILACGMTHQMFTSGTPPQNAAIHFPYTRNDQVMEVCIHYTSPQKLDVYTVTPAHGKLYHPPINSYYDSVTGALQFHSHNYNNWKLDITRNTTGTNLFHHDTSMLCIIVKGPYTILIQTVQAVYMRTGLVMTIDEFYGANLMQNLAIFLGIPHTKIRVVTVVAENSSGRKRRRKRSTGSISVTIQISDDPSDPANTAFDYASLTALYDKLSESYQTGTLQSTLGVEFTYLSMSPPLPLDGTQEWADLLKAVEEDGAIIDKDIPIYIPYAMQHYDESKVGYEGQLFTSPPSVRIVNVDNNVVQTLVTGGQKWRVKVSLHDNTETGMLAGTTEIPFNGGYAIFYDLKITQIGVYKLAFELTHPTSFGNISKIIATNRIVVVRRPLALSGSAGGLGVKVNSNFTLDMIVTDPGTGAIVKDMDWMGHTWAYVLKLHSSSSGSLHASSLSGHLDSDGQTSSMALKLDQTGYKAIEISATSTPSGYSLSGTAVINVLPENFDPLQVTESSQLSLALEIDYTELQDPDAFGAHLANTLQALMGDGTVITDIKVQQSGSTSVVTFRLQGSAEAVLEGQRLIAEYVGTSCPSLTWLGTSMTCSSTLLVDGTPHHHLPTTTAEPEDITLPLVLGLCIPIAVILLIVIIVVLVLKRGKSFGKSPLSDSPTPGTTGLLGINKKQAPPPQFTSQSGLKGSLSSRATSAVSTNPAGAPTLENDSPPGSSRSSSAGSSPSVSSTSRLLKGHAMAPTPPLNIPPSARSKSLKSSSKGPMKVTSGPFPRTSSSSPVPDAPEYQDAPDAPEKEDSALSRISKQEYAVGYSPRDLKFDMSDIS